MQTDPNWLQTRRRQEEGKKRIRAGWSVSTLGKHSAGRLSMFFLVFNHRSVWRGCCDLDNNFLQHIYIPNFFLSWVNQHAICNAPGGNLWKVAFFLPLLSLQKVRTTQHPFSLELPVNTSPNPQALQRKNKGKKPSFSSLCFEFAVFCRLENRVGEHSALGVSLGGEKRLFSHVQLQGAPAAMLQWHGLLDVPWSSAHGEIDKNEAIHLLFSDWLGI